MAEDSKNSLREKAQEHEQLIMLLSRPRNHDHMKGDEAKVHDIDVRCVVEWDDDETFWYKDHRKMIDLPACPAMRQRLARHMRECHGRRSEKVDFGTSNTDSQTIQFDSKAEPKSFTNREVLTDFFGKSIALSPSISMDDKLTSSYKQPQIDTLTAREKHIRSKHSIKNNTKDIHVKEKGCNVDNTPKTRSGHKLKQCETVILHPKGEYEDNLRIIIIQWLIEIPVFPCIDQASKIAKENAVNELNKAICDLSDNINNELYEEYVKLNIRNFLESLPIWFICSYKEQEAYKINLTNNLFEMIIKLNKEIFNVSYDKETYVRNYCPHKKKDKYSKIDELVINYLRNLEFVETDELGNTINMEEVKNVVLKRLTPVVKVMSQSSDSKLYLKSELINIFQDLPLAWPHNKDKNLDKYAEQLAANIQALRKHTCFKHNCNDTYVQSLEATVFHNDHREIDIIKYETFQDIIQVINTVVDTNSNVNIEDELVEIILDSYDSIQSGNESDAKSAIYEYLNISYDITEQSASFLANTIVAKIKNATRLVADKSCSPFFLNKDMLSNNVVVYVSDRDLSGQGPSNYPITSTPKKIIPKLNAEERQYIEDLSKLISTWIDTIPELAHVKEDQDFKAIMVSDLAGHLTDEIKLEQYTPDKKYYGSRENMLTCAVRRWIIKFEENAFANIEDIKPYVDSFIQKFKEISIPTLTRPQHGTRKEMKAARIAEMLFEGDISDENIDMKLKHEDLDIIEDGISMWMNEQPTGIYLNNNRDARNEMLHDFAITIQDQVKNKRPSKEMQHEIRQWLDKILKPNEKKNLDYLSEDLKNRIIRMTLGGNFNVDIKSKGNLLSESKDKHEVVNVVDVDINKTLKDFIDKFIEHNCVEDDTIVKGAFCEILKSEFRRYSPEAKKDIYSKCEINSKSKDNLPQKLTRELYYIKEISDWLKNIPIENSFNVAGNKNRIEFVINLAREICEIEMEKMEAPDAMDYDKYLTQRIYVNHVQRLPILSNCKQYQAQIAKELIKRIVKSRDELNQPHINKNKTTNDSSTIQEQNIGEFIDEYIRINGREIADDPVKLEVWTARLLKEISRMVNESEPSPSFKMKVHDGLAKIPIPGDDSVIEFDRKLMYAHEIGDWIKNMPLKPISEPEITTIVVRMINDLAEKLTEKQSTNIKDDPELTEYVTKWILALPLESEKTIDTSVLIQQLSKRINRVNIGKNQSLNESHNVNKSTSKTKRNISSQSFSKIQKRNSVTDKSKVGGSGELIVKAIEDWCHKLPIKDKNKDTERVIKDSIAVKLFKTVGDLNLDPRLNDDFLYRNQLNDEIDEIFKDLQQHNEVSKKKEDLKSSLINNIVVTRGIIKERTAGNQYRQKLENTIEASIPSPIRYTKIYDPGFELYKNKLANMFILENFDHGDDPVKLKYEVKIKDEIDKYVSEAQKRNAVPLSSDEIYNELYSALFKVPIPNERSVIQEVEEVKLRCEIDGWFEGLPIREAVNLNELLDWDQVLAMLAKRIYGIENNEPKSDEVIHKEVTKWLIKFPLLPGEEKNIDKHAKTLVDRLKASKNERKCTPKSKTEKAPKKGKSSKKTAKRDSTNKGQAADTSGINSIRLTSPIRRESQVTSASLSPCCVAVSTPKRKPADMIMEIVENWCQSLPLFPKPGENEGTIKDDLMTKILRKLSELNANPDIFDDDFLYDDYVDDELDRLMKTLPMCCELQKNAEFKKLELISALRKIKPYIRAERARHEYKKEIRSTVRNMLQGPLDTTPEKALFDDLVDEIVDSFVQINYNKDDYEEKQKYKHKVRDAVIKYYSELDTKADEDTLIKQNKIICELAKIPIPSEEAIKEDVEEIKMKEEVSNFLDEVIPNESTDQKKLIKVNLSKRLHDLEKSGHNCAIDKTMKEEIARSFKKVNTEVNIDKIESFVNTLRNNEAIRKLPPKRRSDELQTSLNVSQQLKQHGWKSGQLSDSSAEPNQEYQPPTPQHYPTFPSSPGGQMSYQYQPSASIKYHTLLPESPGNRPPRVQGPQTMQRFQPGVLNSQRMASKSQEWYTLPPQSPGQRLPSEMVSNYQPSWHALPSPSPRYRPPPEMLQSNLSRQKSVQLTSIRPMSPERSLPIETLPTPGRNLDNRFWPRTQTRRQSLEISSNQSPYGAQRRGSLQAPLRYDSNVHDNRNVPRSYREVCAEPQKNATAPHSLVNIVNNNDITDSSAAHSPRPISPMQPAGILSPRSPRTLIPGPVYPSPQRPRNESLPRQTPVVEPTMSSRPIPSHQGFQNNLDASSPARLAGLPQSTRNAASLREDAAPTVSNIPQETPEDVSPPEEIHGLAAAPQLTNPPRKRRRISRNGEVREEEMCDCFLQSGRKRRCMPLPEDWGSFPLWCYMPIPSFCFF